MALASPGGRFDLALCALVAPSDYMRHDRGDFGHFDALLSYEEIAAAIESQGTPRSGSAPHSSAAPSTRRGRDMCWSLRPR